MQEEIEEPFEIEFSSPAEEESFAKYRLEPKILQELVLRLRGYVEEFRIKNGKLVRVFIKPKHAEPLMNEEGIAKLVALLSTVVAKETVLSNLTPYDIYTSGIGYVRAIKEFLFFNCVKYEIKPENFGQIFELCIHLVNACLQRARYGGERESLSKTIREEVVKELGEKEPKVK